ncbi:MAG: hypothetical protein WAN43_04485 [Rhodomicrobium sp.]
MTRASDDFLKALAGLRQAAAALEGGAREAAAKSIDDLARLAGAEGETLEGGAEGLSFGAALGEARRLAERDLSGNAFYAAVNKLDALASLANAAPLPHIPAPSANEPAPEAAEPAPQANLEPAPEAAPESAVAEDRSAWAPSAGIEGAPQGGSFDEIAAASKARVEEVAASLGVEVHHQHHDAPPLPLYPSEPPAAAELEKRSSEPCAMPEVLPLEAEAAPPVAVEAISARDIVEAAHDIGMPAIAAEPLPEAPAEIEAAHQPEPVAPAPAFEPAPRPEPEPVGEAAPEPAPIAAEAVLEPAPEPVVEAPAPEPAPRPEPAVAYTPEPAPALAKEAPPAAKREAAPPKKEPKPKEEKPQQKTLFGLWLDMVFGRRK